MGILIPYTGKSFDESATEMGMGDIFARLDIGEHILQRGEKPREETEGQSNEERAGILAYIDKQKKNVLVYSPDEPFDFIAALEKLMEIEAKRAQQPREHIFYVSMKRFNEAIDLIDQGREEELQYPFCLDYDWIDKIKNHKKTLTPEED